MPSEMSAITTEDMSFQLKFPKLYAAVQLFALAACGSVSEIRDKLMEETEYVHMQFNGESLLHMACAYEHVELVQLLCENWATVNAKNWFGETPLRIAVSSGNCNLVNVLLTNGADPEGCFKMALENEDRNMALLLHKYGTIFDICQSRCSNSQLLEEFFDIMLSEGKINVDDTIAAEFNFNWLTYERSVQPLHAAVCAGHLGLVKKLVKLGANVNKELESRLTPLHLALMSARNEFKLDITKILLDCGADVNAVDNEDYTPVFYAETDTLLEILIVRGANLNHYSHINDFTPLSYMVSKRLTKCVDVLLWHGADVNRRDPEEPAILERNPFWIYDKNPCIMESLIHRTKDLQPAISRYGLYDFDEEFADEIEKSIHNFAVMIVKRAVFANMSIHLESLDPHNSKDSAYHLFCTTFRVCEKELDQMKETKSKILNFSLFDILCMPTDKLLNYTYNKKLKKLESDSMKKQFPLYAEILQRHIAIARERRCLIETNIKAFQKVLIDKQNICLSHNVLFTVMQFLSSTSLTSLKNSLV